MANGGRGDGLGRAGEAVAVEHLVGTGYEILATNWRPSGVGLRGEIDIVVARDGVIVFVEVKTRRSARHGGPLAAVTPSKQARIRRLAVAYLAECGGGGRQVRFDVIGIVASAGDPQVHHVAEAF